MMELDKLYRQIMGNSLKENENKKGTEQGFFSLYEKENYEIRTYSNLNNVKN